MIWRIEICNKPGIFDAAGEGIKRDIEDLGYKNVKKIKTIQVYLLEGDIDKNSADRVARELLTDKVTQDYSINGPVLAKDEEKFDAVEVTHNPGVMDPVEESTIKGIRDLGIDGVSAVSTAARFLIEGKIAKSDIKTISEKLLYNKVIQHIAKDSDKIRAKREVDEYRFKPIQIDVLGADAEGLIEISRKGQLFLNLEEMKTVKEYFSRRGRNPTDCELESVAQTWSEHCKHK
ncbi:MAG: phosphoribosylformylglycinamidine synthase subunit PurS, partial [Candidatus Omnitrophota bacterium]